MINQHFIFHGSRYKMYPNWDFWYYVNILNADISNAQISNKDISKSAKTPIYQMNISQIYPYIKRIYLEYIHIWNEHILKCLKSQNFIVPNCPY
jgi:hypothetical protein